ncbi:MAG: outer membrane beta-barrel protein [Bacteroidota bacterium]
MKLLSLLIVTLLCVSLCPNSLPAQRSIDIQLEAGSGSTLVRYERNNPDSPFKSEAVPGMYIGGTVRLPLSKQVSLLTNLGWEHKGKRFTESPYFYYNAYFLEPARTNNARYEFAVLNPELQWKFGKRKAVSIQAGPYLAYRFRVRNAYTFHDGYGNDARKEIEKDPQTDVGFTYGIAGEWPLSDALSIGVSLKVLEGLYPSNKDIPRNPVIRQRYDSTLGLIKLMYFLSSAD